MRPRTGWVRKRGRSRTRRWNRGTVSCHDFLLARPNGFCQPPDEARRRLVLPTAAGRGTAPAGDLDRGPAGEVREGRRAQHRGRAAAGGAGIGGRRGRRRARAVGGSVLSCAGERPHPRRADQFRRRHRPQGDADQLLRPAGGRQHLRRRERRGDLRRAERGRRDDAPRRGRGLRLLADPAARGARQGHQQPRQRAAVVHARLRPELRDRRVRGLAPRRADGHPALRSPGHRGVHPREGRRQPHQLQPLGRGDRRLRRGDARRRRVGPRPSRRAGPRPARRRRAPARRRPLGLPYGARAGAVGADHALDLRPRRAGCRVHRHDEPRQQPLLLRDDRGVQSLRHR